MARDELERTEIEAVLETRRELGQQYDAALVDGFADRIERAVEERVGEEMSRRKRADHAVVGAGQRQLALGIVSLVAGIPITAISIAVPDGSVTSLASLAVSWTGIGVVNLAHARLGRR